MAQRIIGQNFINKRQFFYQSQFKLISKPTNWRLLKTSESEVIRVFNIRHVISR
jgi:hypothetical protein